MVLKQAFRSLLDSYHLKQHVDECSHNYEGSGLGNIKTKRWLSQLLLFSFTDFRSLCINVDLVCTKPHPVRKTIAFWNIKDKDIDIDNFEKDILESDIYAKPAADIDEKVMQYDNVLCSHVDKYVPEMMKKVAIKDNRPRMNK